MAPAAQTCESAGPGLATLSPTDRRVVARQDGAPPAGGAQGARAYRRPRCVPVSRMTISGEDQHLWGARAENRPHDGQRKSQCPQTPSSRRGPTWSRRDEGTRHSPSTKIRAVCGPEHLQVDIVAGVFRVQRPCEPRTTNRRRTCWHSAQAAEWGRSAPRNSQDLAAPVQSGGRLTSETTRLMDHQNERQGVARNAHRPNLQVRRPLRPVPGSRRTPRGASSGTGRTLVVCAACSLPLGSTPSRGPGLPGRRLRRRFCGRPGW